MTYDEWEKSQSTPPPPFSAGGIQYGNSSSPIPPPRFSSLFPAVPGLGAAVYNSFRRTQDFLTPRPTTNRSFTPMSGGQPSFSVPPGERPALQMPGVMDKMASMLAARRQMMGLMDTGRPFITTEPPGLRDMPRYGGNRFEANTQYIPPPARSEGTPYPNPPWLNFSNWMDTGERGPIPLDARRPGRYPAPANTPMQEAYDALISGGALA